MSALDRNAQRRLLGHARVARLATVRPSGAPHLVVITFAVEGDVIVTAVDHKPKKSMRLQRLVNIASDPRVSVLFDEYRDEDWSRLWWVRADGRARIVEAGPEHERVVRLLVARYEPYRMRPPEGPAVIVEVDRWASWSGGG